VTVAERRLTTPPATYGRPASVVLATTARAAGRSAAVWGYVFGALVASSAWSYADLYRTAAERHRLAAAFGANKASAALFGPAPALQTVAGFTVFKVSMTVSVTGAVWGLLTSSRLLRGEEEAGRWDLLLAGLTTRRAATAQALGGLAVAGAVLWAFAAAISAAIGATARVGIAPGPALFLALALACPAVMFLAVGAVTSQLAPTRRAAAGYGAAVLGASYGLRMIGDAGVGLHTLTWLSPLGWVEQLAPLTASDPWPLLPITAFTVGLGAVTVRLAGRRDVGGSVLPDRADRPADLRLLGGPLRLSLRLTTATAAGWTAALAVFGLLFGLVARGAGETLSGSSLQATFAKLGATGGGAGAYLGIAFLLVAALLGLAAAGQIGAARREEASGRLDHLVAAGVARSRWLAGRLALGAATVVCAGSSAALCTWLGAAVQGAGTGLGGVLAAGLNAVAPAVFLLGVGALLLGVRPRVAAGGLYAVLAWSVLVELVGGVTGSDRWLLDTSVFHHVSAAPAAPVDWPAAAVVAGLGAVGAAVGLLAFRRRDLVGD
jgi:ABC-2 type transport system permease protein